MTRPSGKGSWRRGGGGGGGKGAFNQTSHRAPGPAKEKDTADDKYGEKDSQK